MTEIRTVVTERDLDAYVAVWNAITPNEPAEALQLRERRERDERRLYLLAETEDGAVRACGFASASDSPARGFLSPRVLPDARRRGLGGLLLSELTAHLAALRFEWASSHVDGLDQGSLAFARRYGFEEVDRQVEQVKPVGREPEPTVPDGVRLVTVAERPELLREAHDLAVEGYADMSTAYAVTIALEDWVRDEATLPAGSFLALCGDEIVGYSGLCRHGDASTAEDGLTVVRRAWRRRGVALALKRAKLHWTASNGIREVVTWTQRRNDGMRALNERLGYVYRSVSVTVRKRLPRTAL